MGKNLKVAKLEFQILFYFDIAIKLATKMSENLKKNLASR